MLQAAWPCWQTRAKCLFFLGSGEQGLLRAAEFGSNGGRVRPQRPQSCPDLLTGSLDVESDMQLLGQVVKLRWRSPHPQHPVLMAADPV